MRLVAIEEHFLPPQVREAWASAPPPHDPVSAFSDGGANEALLSDLGAGHLSLMDEQGVDVQVLSLTTPGLHNLSPIAAVEMSRKVLAYNLRLRGIEVCTLAYANHFDDGIRSKRRKGSRDNLTLWNQDVRQAWQELASRRSCFWNRPGRELPIPLRAEGRFLLVTPSGQRMQKSSLDTRWQKLILQAIECGFVTEDQRSSLHGLKHRGITDNDNKASGGHKSEAMRQRYDHEVPRVEPPRKR